MAAIDDNGSHLWYEKGLRFQCQSCGKCCTGNPGDSVVWVDRGEIEDISRFLGIQTRSFRMIYLREIRGRMSLKDHSNGDCLMLDRETGRCLIYPVRPRQCRIFPFWPELLEGAEEWQRQSRICPGINRGRLWSLEEIHAALGKK